MIEGLNDSTSVGRCGTFRGVAAGSTMGLNTCVAYGINLFAFGVGGSPIGAPAGGLEVATKILHPSWTGRTIEIIADGRSQTIDLRHSLPGPMFTTSDCRWGFDWVVKYSPLSVTFLPEGKRVRAWATLENLPQIFLAHGRSTPVLIVTSAPAESLEIISHEHWWLTFRKAGVRIMLVPLLDVSDAPRTTDTAALWLDLIAAPPVRCAERFERNSNVLAITSTFTTADGGPTRVAPLPTTAALCGTAGGLQSLPACTRLLTTATGPYAVAPGSSHTRTIQMDWACAHLDPASTVCGALSPVPNELAYAGDATWDEQSPMDALLCARQWAPLSGIAPEPVWSQVRKRFNVPAAEAFRASLQRYTEIANGRSWAKDARIFPYCGDISFDTDWYNGLTLSGLYRAAVCTDATLSAPARALSREIKPERSELLAYYEIYNDWSIQAPWTDPRGAVWDLDCSHNGMEGILAEARLRQMESDSQGSDFALYLAGRMASAFVASYEIGPLCYRLGIARARPENELAGANDIFGIRTFGETEGPICVTPDSRSTAVPAPDFPELCALLRKYGPIERLKVLADRYAKQHPERYEDWLGFYVGPNAAEEIRIGRNKVGFSQEQREQAAVFYHVAHDTSLRLWVIGQSGREVEKLYKTPMPLACQLLCRANVRLVMDYKRLDEPVSGNR